MVKRIPTLYFISGNKYKYEEYRTLLNLADLKMAAREILEVQTRLLDVLVKKKAEEVQTSMPGLPFFVEHVGLEIRAWKGLPGGLTSEFMNTVGNDGICRMMQAWSSEREASAVAVIGYSSPGGRVDIFRGETTGTIVDEPRGDKGFGWDAIFLPDGHEKTYAEMAPEEKNRISMRRIVAGKFYMSILRHKFEVIAPPEEDADEKSQVDFNIVQLQQSILKGFDESELRDLCFMLQVDYEDIPGSTRRDKARETIMHLSRRGRLQELVELCSSLRPKLVWA
jgi:non-canonical purine NTP pyrophosphatase (RdgB/HAM1 family)